MNAQQAKLIKTQLQLSSGLNILTPSDDPAAAVRTLSLQGTIDQTIQYQDNIEQVRSRLNIEEGSLSTAETILFRAKELTVQALNSTLTLEDKVAIQAEIDQLLGEMVGVANTKNSNGEYIFSGDLSTTPAFAFDSDVGSYVYQGGVNQRVLDIASVRTVADGDLGVNVFQNISSTSQQANAQVNGDELNARSIFDTLQALSLALGQNYDVPEAALKGDRFVKFGMDYSVTPTSFELTSDVGRTISSTNSLTFPADYSGTNAVFDLVADGSNTQTITLAGNYADQAALISDIQLQISSSAIDGLVEIDAAENPIKFKSVSTAVSPTLVINNETSGSFLSDTGFTSGQTAQPITITLNANYTDLDAVVAAINSTVGLSAINVEARSNGNQIEFISTTKGKDSSVSIYDESPANGTFLIDFGFTSNDTASGTDLGGSIEGNKVSTVLDYATTPASFELNDNAGNTQIITLNTNFSDQEELIKSIQDQIIGSPIEGKIEVNPTANPIQFRSISSGTSASVQINQISGDFLLNTGFTSGDTGRVFSQTANDVLADLDLALDNILKVRTTVGSRLRALDDQDAQNEKFVLDMRSTLSDIRDLDYAEAISRFNLEQTALEAAQQAFARVQNLSLFNFL